MSQGGNQDRRVAFITGASYGVGAATALALARDGFSLALTATRSHNLDVVLADVANAGGRAIGIELDLRQQKSIEDAVVIHSVSAFAGTTHRTRDNLAKLRILTPVVNSFVECPLPALHAM
jgi:NADP-dependent 3-hydroxy acid dehydrogenase YdfG